MSREKKPKREERVRFAAFVNFTFTIVEIFGGLYTNSLAILSDALHDFGDSIALLVSWLFERGAKKAPDARYTFGYQRLSLFSALFSAAVLVGGSIVIIFEAIPRFFNPESVNAFGMVGFAVVGIAFNGAGYFLLRWVGVFVGGIVIYFWKFYLIDPIITVALTVFILYNVVRNLREAISILLQGVPKHINLEAVKQDIKAVDGVLDLHDIHIWSLEGETDVFSAHIVVDDETLEKRPQQTKQTIKDALKKHHIEHSTIELEGEGQCTGMVCEERHDPGK